MKNMNLPSGKRAFISQTVVKSQNNEELFNLIDEARKRNYVQLIITPRVDAGRNPYYWVGLRHEMFDLDFKLLINEEIKAYILAYLRGDEELPTVTNFLPQETNVSFEEWIQEHMATHNPFATAFRDEVSMGMDAYYHSKKLIFRNGKIIYPGVKLDDILSLIYLNKPVVG